MFQNLWIKPMSKPLVSRFLIAAAMALVVLITPAKAELEISIGSGMIDPGGNLTLEIGIASDAPPENLAEFELILQITPLTATGGTSLQFVNPQSEVFLSDADYVFALTSDAIELGETTVAQIAPAKITFADLSVNTLGDLDDIAVTSGQLLVTIDIAHFLAGANPAATAGDQFEISVDGDSLFAQASGVEVGFSSTPGIVTVNAVAVPEPSSVALLMFISCGMMLPRRRRR